MSTPASAPRWIVGTGLIGGSIGLALRARGWHVTGTDRDADRATRALALGAIDAVGVDPDAEVTFVATPVRAIADAVRAALGAGAGVVTDVGQREGRRSSRRWAPPGSWAGTRWPAPSRRASTAPTPTCSGGGLGADADRRHR